MATAAPFSPPDARAARSGGRGLAHADRELDDEGRSLADAARDGDAPVVALGDRLHDRQPEPRARYRSAHRARRAEEPLEEAAALLVGNPHAGVRDRDSRHAPGAGDADLGA